MAWPTPDVGESASDLVAPYVDKARRVGLVAQPRYRLAFTPAAVCARSEQARREAYGDLLHRADMLLIVLDRLSLDPPRELTEVGL